jgi:short-subunit dehydrogenase
MIRAVVITGASRGLGAALAVRFAAPGARLLLVARSAEALAATAAACAARGALAEVAALDVRDGAALAARLAAFEVAGPVDLAIANAGASAGTTPEGVPEDTAAARRMIEVNLVGAINLVGPLLPGMVARGAGQVALVASVSAWRGLPDFPAYCASKAGLLAWGQGLRAAHGPRGVAVTVLLPGFFDSAMGDRFRGARPFKLGLDEAADRAAAAIRRGAAEASFPWPVAATMRGLSFLPARMGDWAARRLRFGVVPDEG